VKASPTNTHVPTPLGKLRLHGSLADRFECFAFERILSDHAHSVVYRETEEAFRKQLDDTFGANALWQGEFWGKWMIGATGYCEYSHHKELEEFILRGVQTLVGMQEPSGYLGTYRDPMNVHVLDPVESMEKFGEESKWNWNIWCRKYTLWGLIEAYRLLGAPFILEAASKLASHLIDSLCEHGISLATTGTFSGIPSGSILKPIVLLYRATGNEKFLAFSREIVASWQRDDGVCPNLISNALSGRPVHEWYPAPKEWAKAYEMMSCFEGIIELFRITGENHLLESAIRFHSALKSGEYGLLFSVGYNDIFANASSQINGITEPCDVIHWMRLCSELFLETGNKAYLDDFELAFYNAFLASVCRDGTWGARGVRTHGKHYYVFEQARMRHNHCCVNNVPRGFLNFAQMAATVSESVISINFYSPFEAELALPDGGTVKLRVTGEYLKEGVVSVEWDAALSSEATLRLRIPAWATAATLDSDGFGHSRQEGWFEIGIGTGCGQATLRLSRTVVIRPHIAPQNVDEWYIDRWTNHNDGVEKTSFRFADGSTISYGPILLARSALAGNAKGEIFDAPLPSGFHATLKAVDSNEVELAFAAEIRSGEDVYTTPACDFASAGNRITFDSALFSIFF